VWLNANGRVAEAEQIIRNAAKLNNITMPDKILVRPEIDVTVDSNMNGEKSGIDSRKKRGKLLKNFRRSKKTKDESARYTMLDIFRNRHLTINIFCLSFLWSVKSAIFCITLRYFRVDSFQLISLTFNHCPVSSSSKHYRIA